MWRIGRRSGGTDRGDSAVADLPAEAAVEWEGTTAELRAEIDRLTSANRSRADRDTERRLLRLRHLSGLRTLEATGATARFPAAEADALPAARDGLPELAPSDVSPALLRAGILRDGCVLVRGLIDRERALRFAERIEHAFAEREQYDAAEPAADGYYEEFVPNRRSNGMFFRDWIQEGGGLLAADSPVLAFEMLELFRAADLAPLVDGYLGEPALISVQKTTLRKATPSVQGAWHQDGSFMGRVRSLNLWLSLSRCGDVAPGLDVVPRRLDHLVATRTDDAVLDMQVSQAKAEDAAGDAPIIRPIFEPGDALFFDELFLHQTASDPSMPHPRYAIENWFFGSSSFPADYAPVAPW